MREEVELFTLEAAKQEQDEWSTELRAFSGMVGKVRRKYFGMSINDEQMEKLFEELVQDVDLGADDEVN